MTRRGVATPRRASRNNPPYCTSTRVEEQPSILLVTPIHAHRLTSGAPPLKALGAAFLVASPDLVRQMLHDAQAVRTSLPSMQKAVLSAWNCLCPGIAYAALTA